MKRDIVMVGALALAITGLLIGIASQMPGIPAENCVQCDAGWYQRIAEQGYPEMPPGADLGHWRGGDIHQTEWAFSPLYPLLVRGLMDMTGLAFAQIVLGLGLLLTLIMAVLALAIFNAWIGPEAAKWGVIALLLQPFGIYFHLGMTEGLFLCALLGAFLSIHRGSAWVLALCATALVLTRPNGLFLLPILLVYLIERDGSEWSVLWERPLVILSKAWPLTLGVVAYGAWCLYQWRMTGTPFAFLAAEAGWGRGFTWPWAGLFSAGDTATQADSWLSLGLLALIFSVRKKLSLAGFNS
ncbi:MAG TPA: hypothetical protein PKD45_14815 [Flavobacteriales bacterium]|nr:hypothetical protein [Flavobacteriales bacterium]